jgi:hypothetical protein
MQDGRAQGQGRGREKNLPAPYKRPKEPPSDVQTPQRTQPPLRPAPDALRSPWATPASHTHTTTCGTPTAVHVATQSTSPPLAQPAYDRSLPGQHALPFPAALLASVLLLGKRPTIAFFLVHYGWQHAPAAQLYRTHQLQLHLSDALTDASWYLCASLCGVKLAGAC